MSLWILVFSVVKQTTFRGNESNLTVIAMKIISGWCHCKVRESTLSTNDTRVNIKNEDSSGVMVFILSDIQDTGNPGVESDLFMNVWLL